MIDKIEKQLEEFHEELREAFIDMEKLDQLYAKNITITIGSQTIVLPFLAETVECITEALAQFIHDYKDSYIDCDNDCQDEDDE
jgi:hypothetical protein